LLKPTRDQRLKLKQWAGCYRWVFNWTVSRKQREYSETGRSRGYFAGRKDWMSEILSEAPWVKTCAAHTVYGAMMDADRAYSAVVGKRIKGLKSELPRCRRKTQKSFFILGNAISPRGIYVRLLGRMRSSEPLPDKPSDSRIWFECGRWYLCVPEKAPVRRSESQGTIALDPGIRTFATGFAQDRLVKIGQGSFGRIARLAQRLDDLLSRASKAPCRKRKRMLQAASRARRKIRRLVEDMHYQTIGWLFRNYRTVIFPEGDFTSACERSKRRLRSKSARSLMTFAFARFRDRLIHKARCMGCNVVVVNEAYTSKTANWTGELVHDLGGRKTISSGGLVFDRDVNGALGIYLKALLVDHPVAVYRHGYC
jgi:putative transposase